MGLKFGVFGALPTMHAKPMRPRFLHAMQRFMLVLSSRVDGSRCRWYMHLLNRVFFNYGKNPKTPNLSPSWDKNDPGSGISLVYLCLCFWYHPVFACSISPKVMFNLNVNRLNSNFGFWSYDFHFGNGGTNHVHNPTFIDYLKKEKKTFTNHSTGVTKKVVK